MIHVAQSQGSLNNLYGLLLSLRISRSGITGQSFFLGCIRQWDKPGMRAPVSPRMDFPISRILIPLHTHEGLDPTHIYVPLWSDSPSKVPTQVMMASRAPVLSPVGES